MGELTANIFGNIAAGVCWLIALGQQPRADAEGANLAATMACPLKFT